MQVKVLRVNKEGVGDAVITAKGGRVYRATRVRHVVGRIAEKVAKGHTQAGGGTVNPTAADGCVADNKTVGDRGSATVDINTTAVLSGIVIVERVVFKLDNAFVDENSAAIGRRVAVDEVALEGDLTVIDVNSPTGARIRYNGGSSIGKDLIGLKHRSAREDINPTPMRGRRCVRIYFVAAQDQRRAFMGHASTVSTGRVSKNLAVLQSQGTQVVNAGTGITAVATGQAKAADRGRDAIGDLNHPPGALSINSGGILVRVGSGPVGGGEAAAQSQVFVQGDGAGVIAGCDSDFIAGGGVANSLLDRPAGAADGAVSAVCPIWSHVVIWAGRPQWLGVAQQPQKDGQQKRPQRYERDQRQPPQAEQIHSGPMAPFDIWLRPV